MVDKNVLKLKEVDSVLQTLVAYTGLEKLNGLLYYLMVIVKIYKCILWFKIQLKIEL